MKKIEELRKKWAGKHVVDFLQNDNWSECENADTFTRPLVNESGIIVDFIDEYDVDYEEDFLVFEHTGKDYELSENGCYFEI